MYFVFLEFLDQQVLETLTQLRGALSPWKRTRSPIHVTVRGPYKREPDPTYLAELASKVAGQGVRIIGAGYFLHGKNFSVFLRAESSIFKDVWWKPDFKTPIADIQPHITMFESEDRQSSMLVLNFLRAARISIHTTSVQLSIYSSKEPDLFGSRPVGASLPNQVLRKDIVAVDEDVLLRARELGEIIATRRKTQRVKQNGDI